MKTLLLVAAALATSGALALAETPVPDDQCFDRDGFAANLKEKYSETRLFPYLSEGGVKFEIFMSPATGALTVFYIRPRDGKACIVSTGRVILEETGRGV
jgi:hypothetical protein